MRLEFSLQFFEKYSNIKFLETPSSGSRVVHTDKKGGRTDMTKLIDALRNFANAPKNCFVRMFEGTAIIFPYSINWLLFVAEYLMCRTTWVFNKIGNVRIMLDGAVFVL